MLRADVHHRRNITAFMLREAVFETWKRSQNPGALHSVLGTTTAANGYMHRENARQAKAETAPEDDSTAMELESQSQPEDLSSAAGHPEAAKADPPMAPPIMALGTGKSQQNPAMQSQVAQCSS